MINIKFNRSDSIEEHANALSNWQQQYDQISSGKFDGYFVEAWFDKVQVLREWTRPSVRQLGRATNQSITILIPIRMSKPGLFCGQKFSSDSIVVFSSDNDFSFVAPPDCEIIAAAIPRLFLEKFEDKEYDTRIHFRNGSDPMVLNPSKFFLNDIQSFFMNLVKAGGIKSSAHVIECDRLAIRDVIIGKAMSALASSMLSLLPSRSFKARSYIVRAAVEYATCKTATPPSIVDVCKYLSIDQRLLNRSFQDVLGVRPLSYFKYIRLNGFKRELTESHHDKVVIGDVAARWGFWHLSRLAKEYKELFGILPSETLRFFQKQPHR